MKIVETKFGPTNIKLETGRIAKQANGSVLVTYGDTVVLVAATAEKGSGVGADFFPLSVHYFEKSIRDKGRLGTHQFENEETLFSLLEQRQLIKVHR